MLLFGRQGVIILGSFSPKGPKVHKDYITDTSDGCCEDTTHNGRGGLLWGIFRGMPLNFESGRRSSLSHVTYDTVRTQKCHFRSTINTCTCCIPLEGIWLSDG